MENFIEYASVLEIKELVLFFLRRIEEIKKNYIVDIKNYDNIIEDVYELETSCLKLRNDVVNIIKNEGKVK